jgi:predicted transcriptional regulator
MKCNVVMTRKVVTCRSDDDLQKALDVMAEYQLRLIPVIDSGNASKSAGEDRYNG